MRSPLGRSFWRFAERELSTHVRTRPAALPASLQAFTGKDTYQKHKQKRAGLCWCCFVYVLTSPASSNRDVRLMVMRHRGQGCHAKRVSAELRRGWGGPTEWSGVVTGCVYASLTYDYARAAESSRFAYCVTGCCCHFAFLFVRQVGNTGNWLSRVEYDVHDSFNSLKTDSISTTQLLKSHKCNNHNREVLHGQTKKKVSSVRCVTPNLGTHIKLNWTEKVYLKLSASSLMVKQQKREVIKRVKLWTTKKKWVNCG